MADSITQKRIVDLVAQTDIDDSVYTIIDSTTGAVKKYPLGSFICSIAPIFDSTASYLAGAYCNYNGQLYAFTEDHDAGAWTGSDVSAVTLSEILEAQGGDITELESDVTALEAAVDGKADTAGVYENLTAGLADQLLSENTHTSKEPFFIRRTPYNATREQLTVVGGTVVWNQLVDSAGKSGSATPSGTETYSYQNVSVNVLANHLLLVCGKLTYAGSKTLRAFVQIGSVYGSPSVDVTGAVTEKIFEWVITTTANATGLQLGLSNITTSDKLTNEDAWSYSDFNVVDITAMLPAAVVTYLSGLTTSAAKIAWLKKYFPDIFANQPYSAPTLKSVEGVSAYKTTGANVFDANSANWSTGHYLDANGVSTVSSNYKYDQSYLPVAGGKTYKVSFDKTTLQSAAMTVCEYDAGQSFIRRTTAVASSTTQGAKTGSFETTANTAFIRFSCPYSANSESQGAKNIVIAQVYTYPLDSTKTLGGYPTVVDGELVFDGDVYPASGTISRRYALLTNQSGEIGDTITLTGAKSGTTKVLTDAGPLSEVGTISGTTLTLTKAISDMSILYELATPTTESSLAYTTPQICDPDGTEEFVTSGVVPVGATIVYPDNLVGKLDGLPWDFATLIAYTESTTKATKAYSQGDYFILNNVLYKVTSSIANGGTITPGTNCTATTIMAEIAAL